MLPAAAAAAAAKEREERSEIIRIENTQYSSPSLSDCAAAALCEVAAVARRDEALFRHIHSPAGWSSTAPKGSPSRDLAGLQRLLAEVRPSMGIICPPMPLAPRIGSSLRIPVNNRERCVFFTFNAFNLSSASAETCDLPP